MNEKFMNRNKRFEQFILLVIISLLPRSCFSLETDTISSDLVIKDPDSIVSKKHKFGLGFFSPENTTNRYLGIFYAFSQETVVWVASSETLLKDSSRIVTISKDERSCAHQLKKPNSVVNQRNHFSPEHHSPDSRLWKSGPPPQHHWSHHM
ncbi:hypothetical protein ACS0TY_027482 [Phlomoides rotata]